MTLDTHPDDLAAGLPDRPPAPALKALTRLEPARALATLALDWAVVVAAIAVAEACAGGWTWWLVYPAVLIVIASRQHGLLVLGHDASHYTLLPDRRLNDLVGDLLCFWPCFVSVATYRFFHRTHHRHLGLPDDGNRQLWRTHDAAGMPTREWTYPKRARDLVGTLALKLSGARGVLWVIKGTLSMLARPEFRTTAWAQGPVYVALRTAFYVGAGLAIWRLGVWREFLLYWIVPFCTWHVMSQYVRLICEHSALPPAATRLPAPYDQTRSTLTGALEGWLLLPHNIGLHIEHHAFAAVPFYNLPRLHALMAAETRFGRDAVVARGIAAALRQCVGRPAPSVRAAAE